MKTARFILTILFFTNLSSAQRSQLEDFEKRYSKKIEVGMSPQEVKKSIGRPKAIQGGFPNTDSSIIDELPEQVGQLNNSTWFYFYPLIIISTSQKEDDKFFINNMEVSEGLYNDYADLKEIYLSSGTVIYPVDKDQFRKLDPGNSSVQSKDQTTTYQVKGKPFIETKVYLPTLCIIFDRGTQVVASTKIIFQLIQ
jgi:hypothetical protein